MAKLVILFLFLLTGCGRVINVKDCGPNVYAKLPTPHALFRIGPGFLAREQMDITVAADIVNKTLNAGVINFSPNSPYVIKISEPGELDDSTHAITSSRHITSVIIDYSIKYNPTFLNDVYDMQSVMIHEYGHVLGLDHVPDDPTSTMYPYLNPGQVRRYLDARTIDTLKCMYNL